jgi:hypothetical protein
MATLAPRRMKLAEFLDWDDGSHRRYELVDGFPLMMAPATEAHGELAAVLCAEIRNRLRPPCRVIGEAGIMIPDRRDTYYVADLAVTCASREPGRRMVVDPVMSSRCSLPPPAKSTAFASLRTIGRCRQSRRSWWFQRRATCRAAAAQPGRLADRGPDRQGRDRPRLPRRPDPACHALPGCP